MSTDTLPQSSLPITSLLRPWLGFLAATTMILGAAYTLWMYKRVIFGPVASDDVAGLTDIGRREFWMLATLAGLVLAFGIYPKPLIDVMQTSVADLVAHVAKSKRAFMFRSEYHRIRHPAGYRPSRIFGVICSQFALVYTGG